MSSAGALATEIQEPVLGAVQRAVSELFFDQLGAGGDPSFLAVPGPAEPGRPRLADEAVYPGEAAGDGLTAPTGSAPDLLAGEPDLIVAARPQSGSMPALQPPPAPSPASAFGRLTGSMPALQPPPGAGLLRQTGSMPALQPPPGLGMLRTGTMPALQPPPGPGSLSAPGLPGSAARADASKSLEELLFEGIAPQATANGAVTPASGPGDAAAEARGGGTPLPTVRPSPSSSTSAALAPAPVVATPAAGLPGNVLVIDDDPRAGALVAAKLLELGYGCLVVRGDAAEHAVAKGGYDVVVLEIPPEEARADGGASRLARLRDHSGPIIATSAAVLKLDHLKGAENVCAILTKPYFLEVLVQAIETARGNTGAQAPAETPGDASAGAGPQDSAQPEGAERLDARGDVRHDLDANVVRAVISGPDGQPSRGRVRTMSTRGALLIDTPIRFQPGTQVTTEVTLLDGNMMLFTGKVLRPASGELAIKLDADETQRIFLERYIEQVLVPNQRALSPVRVALRAEGQTGDLIDDMTLMKRWLEVCESIEDDEIQQRFIQECLRAERLEFAIARYRELKAQRPDDERVAKYLNQIGTILGFYALSKKNAEPEPSKLPSSIKLVIVLFVIAAIALFLILHKVNKGG